MTKRIYPLLLLPMLIGLCNLSARAERFTLTGNTFDERCESLINCMVNDIDPYTGNVNIKYTSAYLWARLYAGTDAERALAQLETLYAEVAADPASVTGSDIDFYAHMTMHGYLLCKNQLPGSLIRKMKQFLQGIDFNKRGSVSTLNLDMMRYTAGFFAAQEWSDFTDLNGKNATEVMEYNRPRILHVLDNIYHNNCEEMDAFVYLPSNTMYIRMLAEYAQDSEVQQKAYVVYQQMLASMAGAWNKGLYIACPPRAKGWNHLVAGPYAPNSRATALAWLYFGNPTNSMKMDSNCTSDSNNYGDFLFWVAYKGKLRPMQAIIDAAAEKGLKTVVVQGEAAFYGPKLDFMVKDAIGRKWQLGTIQVDYNLPERFDLEYTGSDGQKHRPIMIHRAPFGSLERFVAVLLEHTAGKLPLWLTPEQVNILPISEKFTDYAKKVCELMNNSDIRAAVDDRNETVGKRIRESELQRIPFIVIVGEKEVEEGTVSVRQQGGKDLGSMKIEDFIGFIDKAVKEQLS